MSNHTDPYRLAQLNARAAAGNLSAANIRRIQAAMREHSKVVAARIARLAPLTIGGRADAALVAAQAILEQQTRALEATLQGIIGSGRSASFDQILGHWSQANEQAVAALGSVPRALAGAVSLPNLTLAGAYEGLGGAAGHWKTLLRGHLSNAAQDANNIVRAALLNGTPAETLARRLRPYMAGSAPFHEAFGGEAFSAVRDLRAGKIPPHLRDAARKLNNQAKRVAYTEIWNARAEAELQHFAADPLVEAIHWLLAAFRGQQEGPDICDMIAGNDVYGLGRGVYPLGKVPVPPHPYDRCERRPKIRDPEEAGLPKPQGDRSGFDPSKASLFQPGRGILKKFTRPQAARARAQFNSHILATDQAQVAAGIDRIIAESAQAQMTKAIAAPAKISKAAAKKAPKKAVKKTPAPPPPEPGPQYGLERTKAGARREGVTEDWPEALKAPDTPEQYTRSMAANTTRLNKEKLAGWSDLEKQTLKDYTSTGGARTMNAILRAPGGAAKGTKAGLLREAVERTAIQSDVLVYRSIGEGNPLRKLSFEQLQRRIGHTIKTDAGFLSTSADPAIALKFSKTSWVMEIRAPKGTKGAWARRHSWHPKERELLMPPNTKLCLVSVAQERFRVDRGVAIRIIVEVCS